MTTAPNAELAKVHPKAMPVILTTTDDCDLWMSGDWEQAAKLQRPLPEGSLKIVASGEKEDPGQASDVGSATRSVIPASRDGSPSV